jgi:large subunit ribosomal protein L46
MIRVFRNFTSCYAIVKPRVLSTAEAQRFSTALVSCTQTKDTENRSEGFPWRLVAATCVIRFPTVSRDKPELQKRFEEIQIQKETERSVLSNYELQQIRRAEEQRQYEKRLAEGEELDFDTERQHAAQQSIYEEIDEIQTLEEEEFCSFQPPSCETEADIKNDRHTVDRQLRESLYLLVKKPRLANAWQMPQGGQERNESMRQAAQRELQEECGSELQVKFASNLPCGFLQYRFPTDHRPPDETIGAKAS